MDIINLHNFGYDDRQSIDDSPFGGGPGMILRPDVVEKATMHALKNQKIDLPLVYMTPSGKPLKQQDLKRFSTNQGIIILCGRFEGVDARVLESLNFEKISVGDYVLSGGEVASQVLVEGCVRLLPGVLGRFDSVLEESFADNMLEYPHYTRPQVWVDRIGVKHHVPEIIVSGNHEKIKQWRKKESIRLTKKIRPDLLEKCIKEKKYNE